MVYMQRKKIYSSFKHNMLSVNSDTFLKSEGWIKKYYVKTSNLGIYKA